MPGKYAITLIAHAEFYSGLDGSAITHSCTYFVCEEACNREYEDVVDLDAKEGIDDAGYSTNLRSWGCLPVSNSCDRGEGKKE